MPAKEKVRRPRAEVQPFVDLLFREMPEDADWHLGGSWRRGAEQIADLDVMVITDTGMFGDFRFPPSFQAEVSGEQLTRGDLHLVTDEQLLRADLGKTLHVDFWACKPEQAGAFLMFITGPVRLNIAQRARAQKLGLKLSQYGLFRADGTLIRAESERYIYDLLGLDWLDPQARQAWVQAAPGSPAEPDGSQSWEVPSSRKDLKISWTVTRRVTPSGVYWSCTCPGFQFCKENPRICKHIRDKKKELNLT